MEVVTPCENIAFGMCPAREISLVKCSGHLRSYYPNAKRCKACLASGLRTCIPHLLLPHAKHTAWRSLYAKYWRNGARMSSCTNKFVTPTSVFVSLSFSATQTNLPAGSVSAAVVLYPGWPCAIPPTFCHVWSTKPGSKRLSQRTKIFLKWPIAKHVSCSAGSWRPTGRCLELKSSCDIFSPPMLVTDLQ